MSGSHLDEQLIPTATDHRVGLASALLDHLAQEEAALREATVSLESLNQALREASLEQIKNLRGEQEGVASRLEHLKRTRAELMQQSPQTPTIRALTAGLPSPLSEKLDTARERTLTLARQVESLNRQNTILALHCLAFVQDCFQDLYGEASVSRYSSAGRTIAGPRGSLLEAQG
jgi:exonuclease VII large subunit